MKKVKYLSETDDMDDAGYEIFGSAYRSYWKNIVIPSSFSYTYTIYTALGTYNNQIHNLSGVSVSGGLPAQYLRAGSSKYVRQTQTSSQPAEISGEATFVVQNISTSKFILVTQINYGVISVLKAYG